MTTDLLTCPACESDDVETMYPDRGWTYVFCGECGMQGPIAETMGNEPENIKAACLVAETAWNALPRRPGQQTQILIDRLVYALKNDIAANMFGQWVCVVSVADREAFLREQGAS